MGVCQFCVTAMVERVVTPGMLLGNVRDVNAGSGAYERNGEVFASMVGSVVERPVPVTLSASKGELIANKEFEVRPAAGRRDVVPKVGATVTGRVARVNQRFASVEILVVEKTPVQTSFRGIIRVQDVRATEVDKVRSVFFSRCYRCMTSSKVCLPLSLCQNKAGKMNGIVTEYGVAFTAFRRWKCTAVFVHETLSLQK